MKQKSIKNIRQEFQVYYRDDGRDEDCCTFSSFLYKDDMQLLKEFVDMYR